MLYTQRGPGKSGDGEERSVFQKRGDHEYLDLCSLQEGELVETLRGGPGIFNKDRSRLVERSACGKWLDGGGAVVRESTKDLQVGTGDSGWLVSGPGK